MSWIQVYISGLATSLEPSNEDIEKLLDERFSLASDDSILWAGPGTTLVKRDEQGICRGFAFLAFYSAEGASIIIDRINMNHGTEIAQGDSRGGVEGDDKEEKKDMSGLPLLLRAELSNPKAGKERSKKKEKEQRLPDLRLRRQRGTPVQKHPVITSSDKKRTNLGSKTR
jgi:hypothetical protein